MIKVYLLEKDYSLIDKISKRFILNNGSYSLCGQSSDASSGYREIQNQKPDVLVFSYPMNFTGKQLVDAMRIVNPQMRFIALLEENCGHMKNDLTQVGINDVYEKPIDLNVLFGRIDGIVAMFSDPFGGQNPFQSNNPFGGQTIATNPFSNTNDNGIKQPNIEQNNKNVNNILNTGGLEVNNNVSTSPCMAFKTLRQTSVAIHCPKGGVGKTTVSTSIAMMLSTVRLGKQPLNVLLIDMDWDFGDICTNLNLAPQPNIMSWVNDIKARRDLNENADMTFNQAQIEKYLITYQTGLKILAAPSMHSDVCDIPKDMAKIIIDNLKNNCNFDVIIFDCGNNTNDHTLQTLISANMVYEVINMDVASMNDTNLLMQTLRSISFPIKKIKLIVNRVPKSGRDINIHDISEALGLEVASIIPENEKVRVHNNSGHPLVLEKATNPFTEAVKQTANNIMGNELFSKKRTNTDEGKGLISRLFGKK